jgi:hypothetical protein
MRFTHQIGVAACLLAAPADLLAQATDQSKMSDRDFIMKATAGAPQSISAHAAVARLGADGKLTQIRQGTNGFTCSILPASDGSAPFCGDKHAWEWFSSALTKRPRPTNTEPGVAYMMQGGVHHETANGEIVMEPGANTKEVKEPAHWMLMWPIDPSTSGLPTRPNPMGVYVMFAGTPYAHLMVYQNPSTIKARTSGK